MNYIPLHIYTGYSFLSSSLKIKDLMEVSKRNGYSSLGVCDYKNVYAYPSFYHESIKNNIKPIFGITINVSLNDNPLKLCLYIKDEIGYLNLNKIISNIDNLSLDYLLNNSKGLKIVIPFKENNYLIHLLNNDINNLSRLLLNISKSFDDIYLGIEIYSLNDKELMNKVREFASTRDYKCICFPKHLYLKKQDALVIKILDAIKNEEKLDSFNEIEGPYYFLSEKAVNQIYTKDEILNTYNINNDSTFEFLKKRGTLLKYEINGIDTKKLILFKCQKKIKDNNLSNNPLYLQRLNEEISIIESMGYLDYFLIVSDYVSFAKGKHIPVGPGRGSACGSLVSYLLDITDVDPLKYDLFFERFLNPGRLTLPDIDIDIADYSRNEVINYIYSKYGKDHMALVTTFQTFQAKQSLRDIGRVFSINNIDINNICSLIKNNMSLDEAIISNKELSSLMNDSYFKRIIELSKKIEGLPRQGGIHPAGIVLNNDPISEVIPLVYRNEVYPIIQYEKDYLEEQGFLKMDLLGLRNLSLIESITNRIRLYKYKDNLYSIPLNDNKTYELLNKGFTQGIFQLESSGMNNAIKKIQLNTFNDLVALLALYRPGPMEFIDVYADRKNKNLEVNYLIEELKPILESTYGIIVYQEQIMQIVRRVATYSYSQADLFRRAISKKDDQKLKVLKEEFVNSSIKNGYTKEISIQIFNLIEKFASYGFNKSHSVAYSLITYNLAYLKANYPLEFYASILDYSSIGDNNFYKLYKEMKELNISLKVPSINNSDTYYIINNDSLIMPLSIIKGLTKNTISLILEERKKAKFDSFNDFLSRMIPYGINKKEIILLINAGAFDGFKYNRTTLNKNIDLIFEYYHTSSYQSFSLLSNEELNLMAPVIRSYLEDITTTYLNEVETIGILLSGSFFDPYKEILKSKNVISIEDAYKTNNTVNLGILVKEYKIIQTKKKESMGIIIGSDDNLELRMVMFPDIFKKYNNIVEENKLYIINGYFKFDSYRNEKSFIINTLEELKEVK